MKPQTSAALCINTLLVPNTGPEPAKLQPSPARCRCPLSTWRIRPTLDSAHHVTGHRVTFGDQAVVTASHPHFCNPIPLYPWEPVPNSASPIGSQLPGLQHGDHSAPLHARFLLQSNHDDIPSSPAKERRETAHTHRNGDCWQLSKSCIGYPSSLLQSLLWRHGFLQGRGTAASPRSD